MIASIPFHTLWMLVLAAALLYFLNVLVPLEKWIKNLASIAIIIYVVLRFFGLLGGL